MAKLHLPLKALLWWIVFLALLGVFPFSATIPNAFAFEIIPHAAQLDVVPISGCCQRQAPTMGFGILARLPKLNQMLGDVELDAYSDFKFTNGSVAKYFYFIGNGPQNDPASTKEMRITKLSNWTGTVSYGLGFFSHNTNTTLYNLPTLVTGIQAASRVIISYTISDTWSLSGLAKLGLGYSSMETLFYLGFGAGLSYRF